MIEKIEEVKTAYSVKDAAYFLGVTPRTIMRYCNEGRLKYFSFNGRYFKIPEKELVNFLKEAENPDN
jgi:excisionase family DNA binding protein